MPDEKDRTATLRDLNALENRIDRKLDAMKEALVDAMRNLPPSHLRSGSATAYDLRLSKAEADLANMSMSTSQRLAILEMQVLEIRFKLMMNPPASPAS